MDVGRQPGLLRRLEDAGQPAGRVQHLPGPPGQPDDAAAEEAAVEVAIGPGPAAETATGAAARVLSSAGPGGLGALGRRPLGGDVGDVADRQGGAVRAALQDAERGAQPGPAAIRLAHPPVELGLAVAQGRGIEAADIDIRRGIFGPALDLAISARGQPVTAWMSPPR